MMSVTEEKAKTKWCPFARVRDAGASGVTSVNFTNGKTIKCLASDCMAWREDTRFGEPGKHPGYCGLAGKP